MKIISTLTVMCLLFGSSILGRTDPSNSNQQKQADNPERDVLVYLWTARELDGKCHALTDDQKKALNVKLELMLKDLKISADEMNRKMQESGPVTSMDCNGKLAELLFSMAKGEDPDAKSTSEPEKSPEDDDRAQWAFVQQSWQKNFKDLPAGKLAAYEGCWKGDLGSKGVEICIANKGDLVRFNLGPSSTPYCTFKDGGARSRDEYVIFFAPSRAPKCSDGAVIQHVEGACKPFNDKTMKCMITVFSKGAEIFQVPNGDALNGEITVTRGNP
jgi:hypothetical protein